MMKLTDKEHYELMEMFEKSLRNLPVYIGGHFDRADKEYWSQSNLCNHGDTNKLFLVFRCGYAFGKNVGSSNA